MCEFKQLSVAMKGGGLWFHTLIGRWLRITIVGQCVFLAAVVGAALLIASAVDGTLLLGGQNIGLLQHPGIWGFICLQTVLPITLRASLRGLLKARVSLRRVGALDLNSSNLIKPLINQLTLLDARSLGLAALLYSFGLFAFVWNTYQNQLPGKIVPFDFWDSATYPCGFWITRVYKFYLFVWLLPYLVFLHVSILRVAMKLIHSARIAGKLKLLPFHPDGVGGVGFVPELITRPVIVGLLFAGLPTAAAFYVHRGAAVTPIIGLTSIAVSALVAYLIPIGMLRCDISAAKRAMVERLRWSQQAYFSEVIEHRKLGPESLKSCKEAIETCEGLCRAIRSISNYPHLRKLIAAILIATSPTAISLLGKVSDMLSPVIRHWSKLP